MKPFQGSLSDWRKEDFGDQFRVVGYCDMHRNTHWAGEIVHTSRVEQITAIIPNHLYLCETKNSFYILNGACRNES